MDDDRPFSLQLLGSLSEIDKADWDALANPAGQPYHPFVAYDFLEALEASGSVAPEKGWAPRHAVLSDDDDIIAVAPMYMKGHSQGEYIFDHAWADAYERAGGNYYPKLLIAIPFTPAPGPRLLARDEAAREALVTALPSVVEKLGISSLHMNFMKDTDKEATSAPWLHRMGQQFHFENDDYASFDDFLQTLASRKRKNLRKERAAAQGNGLEIIWASGSDITEDMMEAFWLFYQDTGMRKWGRPYLTRAFFSMLIERMADHVLMIMAKRGDTFIAGALNMIGGDTLYGRYWGALEHVPFLHFEICYYQAIDYAIEHRLKFVEAGAQGEHKIARGYAPKPTFSAHFLPDQNFSSAVERYLKSERQQVESDISYLADFTPFKKQPE